MRDSGLLFILSTLFLFLTTDQSLAWNFGGNTKYEYSYYDFPSHAVQALNGEKQGYHIAAVRLKADNKWDKITFSAHYQVLYSLAEKNNFTDYQDADDQRLLDFTHVFTDSDDTKFLHRLDRLNFGYGGDKVVVKIGRQAVSWGNGLVFHAMDIFNPFRPTALDKDYKPGDDMLYGQYLTRSGNDWQLILLPRRNAREELRVESSSLALKYHGLYEFGDIDFLAARHYDEIVAGFGYNRSIYDLLWRADLTVTRLDNGIYRPSIVTNIDYSWIWFEKNFYGYIEYYHNGFGSSDIASTDPELIERIARSELYVRGKNYLAFGLTIELHPLVQFNPGFIINLRDQSGLANLTLQYDWLENLSLKINSVLPFGAADSEFNGAQTPGRSFNLLASYYF